MCTIHKYQIIKNINFRESIDVRTSVIVNINKSRKNYKRSLGPLLTICFGQQGTAKFINISKTPYARNTTMILIIVILLVIIVT